MRSFIIPLAAATLFTCGVTGFTATAYETNPRLINNPAYPTKDLAVASITVTDHGVDNTGNRDCTAVVQQMLDDLAGVGTKSGTRGNYENLSGGILYFPAGTYRFDGKLILPLGVTIRGDWAKPDKHSPAKGTIFKINPTQWQDNESEAFITMQPCTEVSHISFWYPEQTLSNVRQAPPTILIGCRGHWGNEYCNVRFCTFYNSYSAVKFSDTEGGGCPNVFEVYGSPLHTGVSMDRIADVGRLDWISFSPDYWSNSGLQNAPSRGELKNYLYENATGIVMRRNDWTYTCNYEADGYKVAFHGEASPFEASYCPPNGHHYNFNLTNCKTGILLSDVSYTGILFTRIKTDNCETGVEVAHSGSGPAQFFECTLKGSKAIEVNDDASTFVTLQDCSVTGATNVLSGQLQSVNSTFDNDVFVSAKARCIFTGNRFNGGAKLNNNSLFECKVSDFGPDCRPMPEFKEEWMMIPTTRPSRDVLYVVTGLTPLHITDNLATAPDCTPIIQGKLNEAGGAGGGIVYVPKGHYRMDGVLRIPSGVELKGASDLANVPHGQGTVFEVINGLNAPDAPPFISMDERSGVRGIVVNYPNQKNADKPDVYPYTIRGNKDCYIVNVSMRTAYKGVDLFTNKCDNHYVDYLGGHAFTNVIRVGGDSHGGIISNIQFNAIAYAYGYETKFGAWPNSLQSNINKAYYQNNRDLEFFIVGDCTDQVLYNNFLFGCNKGLLFQNDGRGGAYNAHLVGNAVDDAVNTFVFNGIGSDIDLINSQVVALNHGDDLQATFITTGPEMDKTVTLFASDHWGSGNYFTKIQNGTVNLYQANMNQSGTVHTYGVSGGKLNLVNSIMQNVKNFVSDSNHEQRVHVASSILDPTNSSADRMGTWKENLPHGWNFNNYEALLDRDGWKATAFNDVNGTNPISNEGDGARSAIDGNPVTRWDSRGSQTPGQWFAVNLGKNMKFNAIVLDTSGSANDGPAGYTVEVYYDNQWHKVAEGTNAGAMLIATFPEVEASQVRVNQTGSKSNYWSIHEFNLASAETKAPDVPTGIDEVGNDSYAYVSGRTLHMDAATAEGAFVNVYSLQGSNVISAEAKTEMSLDSLSDGIYITVIRTAGGKNITLKTILK